MMNCQNCEAPVLVSDESCGKCGAKLLHRRVFMGVPRAENFTLTAEEPPASDEPKATVEDQDWEFPARVETADAPVVRPGVPAFVTPSEAVVDLRRGGFFRRLGAFIIDILVIALLSALMGAMAYIGYKVGLSAHNRLLSWNSAGPLVSFLTLSCMGLSTVYFVTFHGMEGKTIGKWLLGLRVVGLEQRPITFRRALLRWIGAVGLGCVSLGLAFLWILWQREKRGWHDFLARTWVIRD
jgi:uncharacterized RDD family membrane protein YckC